MRTGPDDQADQGMNWLVNELREAGDEWLGAREES